MKNGETEVLKPQGSIGYLNLKQLSSLSNNKINLQASFSFSRYLLHRNHWQPHRLLCYREKLIDAHCNQLLSVFPGRV
jgi:hypothetical protein